jgi:ABC-type Zn uptake system ZnuABC Zn-binding protein ZnuA
MRGRNGARGRFGPRALLISLAVSLAIPGALCAAQTAAAQGVRLVATTSDLASLARAVTGDLAQVETMIPPATDPEAFQPRPSDLAKLKGASVVARVGLGYDHWLDKLLQQHGDAAVNRGGQRFGRHSAARGQGP